MATSLLKSASITNRDALPRVPNNANVAGTMLRSAVAAVIALAADDNASRYRMISLPSNAYVRGVYLSSVAQGAGAVDVGVYRATADGGAVVDADLFGSAVSIAALATRLEVTNESTNYTTALREQPLWQAAGLAADPGGELDIVLGVTTALTNGGAIGLEVQYTV